MNKKPIYCRECYHFELSVPTISDPGYCNYFARSCSATALIDGCPQAKACDYE